MLERFLQGTLISLDVLLLIAALHISLYCCTFVNTYTVQQIYILKPSDLLSYLI